MLKNRSNMLSSEIDRCLKEEEDINSSIHVYENAKNEYSSNIKKTLKKDYLTVKYT